MSKHRYLWSILAASAALLCAFTGSLAESTDSEEGEEGVLPLESPAPQVELVEDRLETASAANAARLYRSGGESQAYAYWETALGHAPDQYRQKKVTQAMLRSAVGIANDAKPVGREGIRLQQCYEVPLPVQDEVLQKELDYNLHGSIYTDSPLTSVTATFESKAKAKGVSETVTFAATDNVRAYSLVSDTETVEGKSLDDLVDVSKLSEGRYVFTLSATTGAQTSPVTLYSAEVKVERVFPYQLTQNKFDDNYTEALRFFGDDTSKFTFTYSFRDKGREVSTQTTWREANIGESKLGRCNVAAIPNFDQVYDYLHNTYFCVSVQRKNGEIREGKVMLLNEIMEQDVSPYAPRFQSNVQYVSHHTLGTAMDINEHMYPNQNVLTNHELIGNDVKNCLEYRGIKVDEQGRQYYDFFYNGTYTAAYKRVPKTLVNYLLYELAFYRAGFQWGYYYETACDAMHFTLSEHELTRHMDSERGLRKIWVYAEDLPEGVLTAGPNSYGEETTAAQADGDDAAMDDAETKATPSQEPDATETPAPDNDAEQDGTETQPE